MISKNRKVRALLAALLAVVCVLAAPARAWAAGACSLSVECEVSGAAVAEAGFFLYRVGDVGEDGAFGLTEEFAGAGVDLAGCALASEWGKAAEELAAFAKAQGAEAVAFGVSGADGVATFAGLEPGLYLVPAATVKTAAGEGYVSSAFLVALPGQDADGSAAYAVTVEPKLEKAADNSDVNGDSDWKNRPGGDADSGDGSGASLANGASGAAARSGSGRVATTGETMAVSVAAGFALVGIAFMAASRLRRS
ncbi:hypothetical protein [Paratractidigestivibacter sp.]|uniref:hypothetical protein n=1 Tax=Paratractidigestivibacter sp. TaxID=2847316 RepID=UPI002ACB1073|nr:hypothetical protein [Paratractidigestivibacter sp.]